jgi:hypothetical protein
MAKGRIDYDNDFAVEQSQENIRKRKIVKAKKLVDMKNLKSTKQQREEMIQLVNSHKVKNRSKNYGGNIEKLNRERLAKARNQKFNKENSAGQRNKRTESSRPNKMAYFNNGEENSQTSSNSEYTPEKRWVQKYDNADFTTTGVTNRKFHVQTRRSNSSKSIIKVPKSNLENRATKASSNYDDQLSLQKQIQETLDEREAYYTRSQNQNELASSSRQDSSPSKEKDSNFSGHSEGNKTIYSPSTSSYGSSKDPTSETISHSRGKEGYQNIPKTMKNKPYDYSSNYYQKAVKIDDDYKRRQSNHEALKDRNMKNNRYDIVDATGFGTEDSLILAQKRISISEKDLFPLFYNAPKLPKPYPKRSQWKPHKTAPFEWLKLKSTDEKCIQRFRTFKNKDIGWTDPEFTNKIVDSEQDDDYSTDDGILNRSIQKVQNDLVEAISSHLNGFRVLNRSTIEFCRNYQRDTMSNYF